MTTAIEVQRGARAKPVFFMVKASIAAFFAAVITGVLWLGVAAVGGFALTFLLAIITASANA